MIEILRRTLLRQILVAGASLFFLQIARAGADESVPVLKLATESTSEDGHIKIEWELPALDTRVEVQQAKTGNFEDAKIIYRGPDNATFVSGLENGTYYYRVRKVGGAWSDPVTVKVKHHSLQLAFILFGLGGVVFVLTVFVVVKGALNSSSAE